MQYQRVLLLNANWMPLHFISEKRAMTLLVKEKAEIVDMSYGRLSVWEGAVFCTATRQYEVPATIRLLRNVNCSWKPTRYKKMIMFERDRWECQYCGARVRRDSATVDHVVPKSKNGPTTWENCVTACKRCNKKKANKMPSEAGMKLLRKPRAPRFKMWTVGTWHSDWSQFVNRDA